MSARRARVELKPSSKSPKEQLEELKQIFKRRCNDAGIIQKFKDHEYFVSKAEKRRKKKRESELRIMKEKAEALAERRMGLSYAKRRFKDDEDDLDYNN